MNNPAPAEQQNTYYVLRKDVILNSVVEDSLRAAELLMEYGLHCMSCHFSEYDTLETGAQIHGMKAEEIDDMIVEINAILKEEWAKGKKVV